MDLIERSYKILTWKNNPILRSVSEEIDWVDEDVKLFSEILLKLMRRYDGVWLAAPQIWKNVRMIATTQRKMKDEKSSTPSKKDLLSETVMINPAILEKSEKMITYEEACLSLPDLEWKVKRHESIVVTFTDINGKVKTQKLKWFNAVIVQHEIDHLDAILFVDRAIKWTIKTISD